MTRTEKIAAMKAETNDQAFFDMWDEICAEIVESGDAKSLPEASIILWREYEKEQP